MWTEANFWPLFKATGMLDVAEVGLDGGATRVCVDVGYSRPDVWDLNGSHSEQHQIEYQAYDLPTLAEGEEVIIKARAPTRPNDILFRVRQPTFVPEAGSNNGFFRIALLTRV